jgi:hypothetical protein
VPVKALIITTEKWPTTAILAHRMGIAGFAVAALCPSRHPLRKLSRLEFAATYFHPARFALLRRAIAGWRPDLLVPGDDAAVALLHDLHRRSVRSGTDEARRTAALIEASLGGFAEPEPVRNRSALVGLAASLSASPCRAPAWSRTRPCSAPARDAARRRWS